MQSYWVAIEINEEVKITVFGLTQLHNWNSLALLHSNVGCYRENIFVGALAYADDLILLAPNYLSVQLVLWCELHV